MYGYISLRVHNTLTDPTFNLCCYDTSTMYAATNNPIWMQFFYQEFINILLPDPNRIHVRYQSKHSIDFEKPLSRLPKNQEPKG